jgi:hypothetical protein
MTICSRRRQYGVSSRMVLFAVMLQAVAATAPAVCAGMSASPESTTHSAHIGSVSVAEVGGDSACDCGPGQPAESGERELGSCSTAAHCVSSPAVVAGPSMPADPAIQIRSLAHVCTQPQLVALSHPTPPPRI